MNKYRPYETTHKRVKHYFQKTIDDSIEENGECGSLFNFNGTPYCISFVECKHQSKQRYLFEELSGESLLPLCEREDKRE